MMTATPRRRIPLAYRRLAGWAHVGYTLAIEGCDKIIASNFKISEETIDRMNAERLREGLSRIEGPPVPYDEDARNVRFWLVRCRKILAKDLAPKMPAKRMIVAVKRIAAPFDGGNDYDPPGMALALIGCEILGKAVRRLAARLEDRGGLERAAATAAALAHAWPLLDVMTNGSTLTFPRDQATTLELLCWSR